MHFTKDGKAFIKNASGRITDIPASQVEIYVAQGYKLATEEEVRAAPTFKHVFDGNYGKDAKVDPSVLSAMNQLSAGMTASLADRLNTATTFNHGETLTGAEPQPPIDSFTSDGFPRAAVATPKQVVPQATSLPAAPTLERGKAPDNIREAVGRRGDNLGAGVKEPEQAIKDGDVRVTVTTASTSVGVRTDDPARLQQAAAQAAAVQGAAIQARINEVLQPTVQKGTDLAETSEIVHVQEQAGDAAQPDAGTGGSRSLSTEQATDDKADATPEPSEFERTFTDPAIRKALEAAGLDSVEKVSNHDYQAQPVANIGEGRLKTITEALSKTERE